MLGIHLSRVSIGLLVFVVLVRRSAQRGESSECNVILEDLGDTLPNSAIEDIIADTIHQEEELIETIQKMNQ